MNTQNESIQLLSIIKSLAKSATSFLLVAGMLLVAGGAQGSTLYWSGNGTILGGAGSWDTTSSTNWGTAAASPFGTVWTNSNNDTAVFTVNAAGPATVTLTENITVGALTFTGRNTFNGNTYTLNAATNSRTLSFSSGDNTILFNPSNGAPSAFITGQVAGIGANVIVRGANPVYTSMLTFNGASTGGWTGATTINASMTLATVSTAALTNRVLADTSGITLNGGTIQFTRASIGNIDAISSSAIGVNGGGTFSVTSSGGNATAIENIGTVTVNSGQMNFVQTANNPNSLVLAGLSRGADAAVTFSSANLTSAAFSVSGASATAANEIIGPWATVGTTAALQTDYAIFDASANVLARNTAGSLESTWATAVNSYVNSSAAQTLGATRTITALRNTGATATLTLASGANLETYGVLNGVTTLLTVAPGTGGVLTTPTGGGNLYLNAGSGAITVSAPISNNVSAVTLVKSGSGILTLSANNTFTGGIVVNAGTLRLAGTQSFTGGITLSGGVFGDSTDGIVATEINSNSVTVNGNASMFITSGQTIAGAVAINSTGNLLLNGDTATLSGVVSGSGGLSIFSRTGTTVTLTNPANTHTGVILIYGDNNQPNTLAVNSLADSASPGAGNIQLGTVANGGGSFALHTGAVAALILNNRQFDLQGDSNVSPTKLSNNSAQAFTINSNLRASGTATRTLTLGGTGTGLSTFGGSIGNGGLTTLHLTKADANNTWALTNAASSYNGVTTVTAGTLRFTSIANAGSNSSLGAFATAGATGISLGAATLQYMGASGVSVDRGVTLTATSTIDVNPASTALTLGASSIGAFTLNVTGGSGSSLGLGALTLTGAATLNPTTADLTVASVSSVAAQNLTLGGISTGNSVGAIATLTGTLTKNTASTWTLSGVNTYSGTTTVSGGKLLINGSLAAGSAVSVTAGALGGAGTVGGAVTLSGTGGIDLRDGAVGTLTVSNNLAISGSAAANNLYFDFNGSFVDQLSVTGSVSMTTSGAGVINLNLLPGTINNGTYDLITVTGTLPAASSFTLATTKALGKNFSLQVTGSTLQLVVTDGTAGGDTAWTGTSSASWGTAGNWTNGVPGLNSIVTFYNTGALNLTTIALNGDYDIGSLVYATGATSATTIGAGTGGMLTLESTSGSGITVNTPSSTHTISAKVGLAASQTWTVANGGTLAVSGVISDFGSGCSLTKAGAGVLTLSGANTFTGGIVMNGGRLTLTGSSLNNNPITFNTNAVIYANTTASCAGITINNAAMASIGCNTATLTVSGAVTGAGGGITLAQSGSGATYLNFNSTANTFTGPISYTVTAQSGVLTVNSLADSISLGSGNITFGGAATTGSHDFTYGTGALAPLTLNNRQFELAGTQVSQSIKNNSSQAFTINTGLLVTGTGAKTLTLGGSSSTSTFAGTITNGVGSVISLTKADAGTWILSGNNTYGGGTTVSAGILKANGANALGASNVTVNAGTLQIDAADAMADTAVLRLPSLSAVNLIMNANDTIGVLYVGGVQQPNGVYTSSGAGSGWMTGSGVLTVGAASVLPLYWDINDTTSGAGGATPTGSWNAGNWNAASDGTGSTAAWIAGRTVAFAAGTDASGTYTVTVDGTHLVSGLTFEEGAVTLAAGTAPELRLVSDSVAYVATNRTATVETPLTQDATTRSLIKSGPGTLILSGANTYAGGTTLGLGTLSLGGTTALGTGALTIAGGALDSAVADLINTANNAQSWNSDFTFVGSQNLNMGAGAVPLAASRTVTVNTNTLTVGGVISGAFALTKAGGGTLTLTGTNSYSGATSVNVGTLMLDGGVVSNSTLNVGVGVNNASLVMTNGARFFAASASTTLVGRNNPTSTNNTMTVVGGTAISTFNGNGGALRIGSADQNNASEANFNSLLIRAGGVVTNISIVYVGYATAQNNAKAHNNQLVVTDGGNLFATSSLRIGFANSLGGDGPSVTNNSMLIANGSVVRAGGEVYVGALDRATSNGQGIYSFNGLTITNGGQLYSGGTTSCVGWVVSTFTTAKANSNTVTIAGSLGSTNSLWDLGNKPLIVGYTTNASAAIGNVLRVNAGGMATNISKLTVSVANTLALGAGGQIYASAVTNAGTMTVGLDDTTTPTSGRLTVSGNLDLNNATLNIVTNGTPLDAYVIASYSGSLTGVFAATNGLPSNCSLDMNYKGLNQIAIVGPGSTKGTIFILR